jgi:TonB family protein
MDMFQMRSSICAAAALAVIVGLPSWALGDGNDRPPQVDLSVPHDQPPYPVSAQTSAEQGVVAVDVLVRPNGKPARIKVSRSSGFEDLDNAAIQGVLNWRFVPAMRDGDAVSDWTTVKIVYQLPTPIATPASMTVSPTH